MLASKVFCYEIRKSRIEGSTGEMHNILFARVTWRLVLGCGKKMDCCAEHDMFALLDILAPWDTTYYDFR